MRLGALYQKQWSIKQSNIFSVHNLRVVLTVMLYPAPRHRTCTSSCVTRGPRALNNSKKTVASRFLACRCIAGRYSGSCHHCCCCHCCCCCSCCLRGSEWQKSKTSSGRYCHRQMQQYVYSSGLSSIVRAQSGHEEPKFRNSKRANEPPVIDGILQAHGEPVHISQPHLV